MRCDMIMMWSGRVLLVLLSVSRLRGCLVEQGVGGMYHLHEVASTLLLSFLLIFFLFIFSSIYYILFSFFSCLGFLLACFSLLTYPPLPFHRRYPSTCIVPSLALFPHLHCSLTGCIILRSG
jgi:hypothetical protein